MSRPSDPTPEPDAPAPAPDPDDPAAAETLPAGTPPDDAATVAVATMPEAAGNRRPLGEAAALFSLLVSIWVVLSPTVLAYPLSAQARDTAIWGTDLGVILAILATARLRAPGTTRRAAAALLVGAVLMVALPFATISTTPQGPMRTAWWNSLICGLVLVVLAVVGLVRLARAGALRRRHRVS